MQHFFETIRISKQQVINIKHHNQRCANTRREVFGDEQVIDLLPLIDLRYATKPEMKCKVIYHREVCEVSYQPYIMREINSLKVVEVEGFDYRHKGVDRSGIQVAFEQKSDCDDVLMTMQGFVTDTSYCNVAFLKDRKWYTPLCPMLKGTKRAKLLDGEVVETAVIKTEEIQQYEAVRLFNAMIDFGAIEFSTKNILL